MIALRKTARELALRVVYQLDVGKGLMEDAMPDVLDQIAYPATQHLGQIRGAAAAEAERTFLVAPKDAWRPSIRKLKLAARSAMVAIQELETGANGVINEALHNRIESEELAAQLELIVQKTITRLQSLRSRDVEQKEPYLQMLSYMEDRCREVTAPAIQGYLDALDVSEFCDRLVVGVQSHMHILDDSLKSLTKHWSFERMAAVDRSILRLSAYELMYVEDSPDVVVINEAVELAKKYSTADSGKFVNGVLGALAERAKGMIQPDKAAKTGVTQ